MRAIEAPIVVCPKCFRIMETKITSDSEDVNLSRVRCATPGCPEYHVEYKQPIRTVELERA